MWEIQGVQKKVFYCDKTLSGIANGETCFWGITVYGEIVKFTQEKSILIEKFDEIMASGITVLEDLLVFCSFEGEITSVNLEGEVQNRFLLSGNQYKKVLVNKDYPGLFLRTTDTFYWLDKNLQVKCSRSCFDSLPMVNFTLSDTIIVPERTNVLLFNHKKWSEQKISESYIASNVYVYKNDMIYIAFDTFVRQSINDGNIIYKQQLSINERYIYGYYLVSNKVYYIRYSNKVCMYDLETRSEVIIFASKKKIHLFFVDKEYIFLQLKNGKCFLYSNTKYLFDFWEKNLLYINPLINHCFLAYIVGKKFTVFKW